MISVILPVYNGEKSLTRAVDSMRAQTMRDWELLIADDGSTDASAAIAQSLAVQDHRIRVVTQPHGGVSYARNRALEQARGELVAFLDSDDELETNHLQTLFDTMGKNDLAVCGYHVESNLTHEMLQIEADNPYIDFAFSHIAPSLGSYTGDAQLSQGIVNLLETDTLYPIWNKLYRRELIERHHIRFDQTLRSWGEDELFNFTYLRHCASMSCTDVRTIRYMTQDFDALSYQYDDLRLFTEQRLHRELTALLEGKAELTRDTKCLLGEIYIGKLVLLLEHDQRQDFAGPNTALQERWEVLLCDRAVQDALHQAELSMQFASYLNVQLLLSLFLPSMIMKHTVVSRHIIPRSYLRNWLFAIDCAKEQDERFEQFHRMAMQAGAPWPLDYNLGGAL